MQDDFGFVESLQVPSRTSHRQNCEADQGCFFRLNIGQTNYPSIAVRSAFASKFNFKHIGRPDHQLKKGGNLSVNKCWLK